LDAPAAAGANGPEGEALAWLSIDWQRVEGDVRRLRQRIFTASREGDLKKVRNLQKLMLRSRANALVAVRRVAEVNAGRMTAGIDGMTVLGPQSKADLADWAQRRTAGWDPWPIKRAWVPKAGGRQRPPAPQRPPQPPGTSARPRALEACLSRVRGRPARPVLRGPGRSNAASWATRHGLPPWS
jgi:hypothetical protein